MSTIDEPVAWRILQQYAGDCPEIASGTLLALYATGSLPGGYYRPGQSDIDATIRPWSIYRSWAWYNQH